MLTPKIRECLVQVFVASALMEWHYDNSSAKVPNNIWEMGAKRFMAQPGFALAYTEFQLGLGDTANARATFERALTVTPPEEAQPLWDEYLKFEVQVDLVLLLEFCMHPCQPKSTSDVMCFNCDHP